MIKKFAQFIKEGCGCQHHGHDVTVEQAAREMGEIYMGIDRGQGLLSQDTKDDNVHGIGSSTYEVMRHVSDEVIYQDKTGPFIFLNVLDKTKGEGEGEGEYPRSYKGYDVIVKESPMAVAY